MNRLSSTFLISSVLGTCLAGIAGAQAPSSEAPQGQDQAYAQLLKRLEDLEAEVQRLRSEAAASTASAAVPAPAAAASVEPAVVAVTAAAPAVETAPEVNEVAPRLKMEVFGDVGAQGYSHIPHTFYFGSLDLFMTARLSDRVTTLGELLFIAESDNSITVDVERLLLKYRQNQYLTATVGRYHTWVGYYNSTYNKGEFLETATDRPYIFDFDDDGGVLPMQDVGVNVTGKIPSGKLGLNYVVELGNGRAWGLNAEPAQSNQDANNSKSINGGLFIRPKKYDGLEIGFSLRRDNLSIPGPSVGETIATAHAVLNNGTYEILNEAVWVRHNTVGVGLSDTAAGYSQISRLFGGKYRPYFRYQYFNAPSSDPVYQYASSNDFQPPSATEFVGRVNGPSAGLRYDFAPNSAIKLQYDRISERGLATVNGLTAQVAFTF